MTPEYVKHFPQDWSTEKIITYVTDIATDPNIEWHQITWTICTPPKYIADGEREGLIIRVILEPKDRGILTAYTFTEYAE